MMRGSSLIGSMGVAVLLCAVVYAGAGVPDLQRAYTADVSTSYQQTNAHRSTVSLNGVWRIALTGDLSNAPPESPSDYGYVLVPSSWMHPVDFPITGASHFSLGTWNGNSTWKGRSLSEYPVAWYVREFVTPSSTQGKAAFLELERCTIQGTVYLNGERLGIQHERDAVRWPVADHLKPAGQTNTLAVRVVAMLDEEVKAYLGGDEAATMKASATLRGITGDVWLYAEPMDLAIHDLFVTTSVRRKEIAFKVSVDVLESMDEPFTIRVVVHDSATGTLVKVFKEEGVHLSKGATTISFTRPWDDAVLWDLDQPHLYQAVVSVEHEARTVDTYRPVEFGFREVEIDGHKILLNGNPLHLFSFHAAPHNAFVNAARANIERGIDVLTDAGFNSIQLGFEGTFRDGHSAQYYKDILDITDHRGIPVILPIFPVYSYGWEDEERRQAWERHVEAQVRKYRNHPSVLIYAMNFNYLGYAWDMNPHAWANDYAPPDRIGNLGQKRRHAAESLATLRSMDDSRLVYNHASGNFGDFMTSNFYPCWPPMQELEDALSGWAETGAKPLVFVELSLPVYILDLFRAREGNYMMVQDSEPLQAEYLAPTLGPQAYASQSDEYLELIAAHATTETQAGVDKYAIQRVYSWDYMLRLNEVMTDGMLALRPPLFRTWRTYGLTGFSPNNSLLKEVMGEQVPVQGGIAGYYAYADYTRPGPKPLTYHTPLALDKQRSEAGLMMRENLKPLLFYWGGDADSGFSAKDHAWFSGDAIHKQLVVVNDTRRALDTEVHWALIRDSDKKAWAQGTCSVHVAPGTSGFYPVTLPAPAVEGRTEFTLTFQPLNLKPDQHAAFPFALQVFPRERSAEKSGAGKTVGLFDPEGETVALLKQMGISYQLVDGESSLEGLDLLVVGRGALSAETRLPVNLLHAVKEQGATLVCLEQSNLDVFNLRLHPRGERVTFPLIAHHPLLAGLEAVDMRDWRGAISLSEPYPKDRMESPDRYPEEFWKWGNRGVVASSMIERPHMGGLKSIAVCGFDLNYTPLAEFREGRGRVILSQLEATLRYGKDPAATIFLDNLLAYAVGESTDHTSRVRFSGEWGEAPPLAAMVGDEGGDDAGIVLCRNAPPEKKDQDDLLRLVASGGTVFLIGQEALKDLSWLPLPVKTVRQSYFRAVPVGDSALGTGISFSDLFIKDQRDDEVVVPQEGVTLLADPGIIAEVPHGKGRFVLFAIDPLSYAQRTVTPERSLRIYHKLLRVLSTMLTNLGVESTPLSERYLAGISGGRFVLPEQWRFQIDPDNNGVRGGWHKTDYDDSAWDWLTVPGYWENQGVTNVNPRFSESKRPYDGFAWYRCTIDVPERFDAEEVFLHLGAIDDMDVTYLNGKRIGQTGTDTPDAYAVIRNYAVPREVLRPGQRNTLAVRVYDNVGQGGLLGPDLYLHQGEGTSYPYMNAGTAFNPYRLKRW